jgi:glycine/D-amino acid oxidase-like deaminating enzyme
LPDFRYEWLSGRQLRTRYPQFTPDDKYVAVYQKDGGLVDAAMINAVHILLAGGNGVSAVENCPVLNLARNENGTITVSVPITEIVSLF